MTNDSSSETRTTPSCGFERREGIVCDFGTCRRDHGEQGRFSGVWNAHDSAICEKAQFEAEREALAGLAALGETRCLPDARGEVLIAEAAATALRRHDAGTDLLEIGHEIFAAVRAGLEDQRPDRNANRQIFAAAPRLVRTSARSCRHPQKNFA